MLRGIESMSDTRESLPEKLLGLAREGDGRALGTLLESYRNYLWILAHIELSPELQSKANPSDLVQETFMAAQRNITSFRGQTEVELLSWLRRMLASKLVNLYRRYCQAQRRDVRLEQQLAEKLDQTSNIFERGLVAPQSSPSEQVIQRERAVALADALRQLPSHYRNVILLHQVEGLSFAEVAKRTGRSLDSVKKLWIRGLVCLRDHLREDLESG
jgi:RNA polymerase sigma-70 factor, ECF subfamily